MGREALTDRVGVSSSAEFTENFFFFSLIGPDFYITLSIQIFSLGSLSVCRELERY